jgi:AcrR family transcriptional regulator
MGMDGVGSLAPSANHLVEETDLWADIPSEVARRILQGAADSFARVGFHATTTRDISASSGLSPAAMYVHFASKEELLFEITRLGHEAVLELTETILGEDSPPDRRIHSFVYAFSRWHAEHHNIARVAQYEMAALSDEHARVIADLRTKISNLARTVIGQGAEAGVFRVADVHGATTAVLSLGIDIARWFRPGGHYTPDGIGHLYSMLILNMLGHESPARWVV